MFTTYIVISFEPNTIIPYEKQWDMKSKAKWLCIHLLVTQIQDQISIIIISFFRSIYMAVWIITTVVVWEWGKALLQKMVDDSLATRWKVIPWVCLYVTWLDTVWEWETKGGKNAVHTCSITTVQDVVLVIISWLAEHFPHTVSVCLNSQAQVNGEEILLRICAVIIDLVMMVW